jgi:predicted permease
VLAVAVVVPVLVSMTGNPAGPFLAAFVSTALVMFGLFELGRRLLHSVPVGRIWAVLGAGVVVGVFVNMGTVLGPGIYAGFLVGQALTVGLVLWLVRSTRTER